MSTSPPSPTAPEDQANRPGNLANQISLTARLLRMTIAFVMGVLSSVMFAPVEWTWTAWLALAPLLLLGLSRRRGYFMIGYAWGLGHFLFSLAWLKEVFLPAPLGVALICAAYPGLWLWIVVAYYRNLQSPPAEDLLPQNGQQTCPQRLLSPRKQILFVLGAAALWCGLEWIRSWLFTGFPWNQLGISQWQNSCLLPLASYTGVDGLSFLIVAISVALALEVQRGVNWKSLQKKERIPAGLLAALLLGMLACTLPQKLELPVAKTTLRVACVQGNIPQIRNATREEYWNAVEVYSRETIRISTLPNPPDLIVWPETALPYPLFEAHPKRNGKLLPFMKEVVARAQIPMISGMVDFKKGETEKDLEIFNSAVQLDKDGKRINVYDKIHIVPFGEFLPFEEYWPKKLKEHDLFMRSLTRGKENTIFKFKEARIGMNICYEDIFPEISRASVLQGANLLLTITNDAWYNETSGSHQHLSHTVFRAVETGRPMLRSGNNSDTCLILPDGRVTDRLVDPNTGNPFYRGYRIYEIPICQDLPTTFYVRHGNLFVRCVSAAGGLIVLWCLYRFFYRRQRILNKLSDVNSGESQHNEGK